MSVSNHNANVNKNVTNLHISHFYSFQCLFIYETEQSRNDGRNTKLHFHSDDTYAAVRVALVQVEILK